VYERLTAQHEECKEKIASCEQQDVRARQVRAKHFSLLPHLRTPRPKILRENFRV